MRIAVVGTGISGLAAAWLLERTHDVTVFERNAYMGGHSHTARVTVGDRVIDVDTGFIVYNPVNYPNLVALFDHLGVPTAASDMSFSASLRDGHLEYAGTNLAGLFAGRRNLLRPRFWRMLTDLRRFYAQASVLADDDLAGLSLGAFLAREHYSDAFVHDHLVPMGAAIWSSSVEQMLAFPALAFIRFFHNHGLVQLHDRPAWRTVAGGSQAYVRRLSAGFADRIRLNTPVERVTRHASGVTLTTPEGTHEFDHVVLACHADQALHLLDRPSHAESATLGRLRYQANRVVLHTDPALMPRRRRAWASWNYIGTGAGAHADALCVTYWMNRLQPLGTETPVFVTLNPRRPIDDARILGDYHYAHPVFDAAALDAQERLWDLQGERRTWFCGAWFGAGFHEDGLQAGLAVAERLGGSRRPWRVAAESGRIGLPADWARAGDIPVPAAA